MGGKAAEGVNLVLLACSEEVMDQIVDEIKKGKEFQVLAVLTDNTNMEGVNKVAAITTEKFGTVQIVVNNVHNRVRRSGSQLTWMWDRN